MDSLAILVLNAILAILVTLLVSSLIGCTTYRENEDGSRSFSTAARMVGDAELEVTRDGFRMSADVIDNAAGLREGRLAVRDAAGIAAGGTVAGRLIDPIDDN